MTSELENTLASATSKLARLKIWEIVAFVKEKAIVWKERIG